jgi:competence protein ComGB
MFWKNTKKLPNEQQANFFKILGRLLQSGYSINESVDFLKTIWTDKTWLAEIRKELRSGVRFSQAIAKYVDNSFGFQLTISDNFGLLSKTLISLSDIAENQLRQNQKIKQVLKYPTIILIFIAAVFLGVIFVVYPMMKETMDIQSTFIDSPGFWTVLFAGSGVTILLLLSFAIYLRKLSALTRTKFLIKLPIVGPIIKQLVNYQFARMYGDLLGAGLEIKHIVQASSSIEATSLQSEMASFLKKQNLSGISFAQSLKEIEIIDESIQLFFQQGNDKNRVSKDLTNYSQIIYADFVKSVDKVVNLIQPVSFILVALVVVFVYAILLLPMYQNINFNFS